MLDYEHNYIFKVLLHFLKMPIFYLFYQLYDINNSY